MKGYATINGINMYYEIQGEGFPLVLIHGGGSTIQTTFGTILPLLAGKQKIIAVELQAHGHTSDRNAPETFEQDADDVAALLVYLKIEKANFIGFSNGGNTAMQIAIRHPEVVNKLVIISSFYKREGMIDGFFDWMKNASLENMPAPLQEAFLKINNDRNALQIMHDKDASRMVNFKDWSDENLYSIHVPVLLIYGDKDVVKLSHALEIKEKIPTAQMMILPGTHGECIGEICSVKDGSKLPELTVAVINEFLREETLPG